MTSKQKSKRTRKGPKVLKEVSDKNLRMMVQMLRGLVMALERKQSRVDRLADDQQRLEGQA